MSEKIGIWARVCRQEGRRDSEDACGWEVWVGGRCVHVRACASVCHCACVRLAIERAKREMKTTKRSNRHLA